MYILLALLSLSAQSAHSTMMPMVVDVPCREQKWPNLLYPHEWETGELFTHKGFEESEKSKHIKIADFFISLTDYHGEEPAILCTASVTGDGAEIDAFWVSEAGGQPTKNFAFAFSKEEKTKVRFGIKGMTDTQKEIKARVEVYGIKGPNTAEVTCAVGPGGKACPGQLNVSVRMQEDP